MSCPPVALVAACSIAVLHAFGAAGGRSEFQPAFTLEQAVQVRTIGETAMAPDGRSVAVSIGGHYFGFPVVPRFAHDNNLRVVSLDTGEIRIATSGPFPKTGPVFSPAGDRLAFESENDIWIVNLTDGRSRRITTNGGRDSQASWSPDGRMIAFVSNRSGSTDLWAAAAEGERHGLIRLTDDLLVEDDPQWSPDGRRIVYSAKGPLDFYAQGLFLVPASGGRPQRITPADNFDHSSARWSPDGQTLAFISDRTGYMHVWTMNPDGSGSREYDTGPFDSASPHFAVTPVWSPEGTRLLTSVNRGGRYALAVIDLPAGRVVVARDGPGQHHESGWTRDGQIVHVYENAWSPPDVHVGPVSGTSRQVTFSSHVMFREPHMASIERVQFGSTGGLQIPAFLMKPRAIPTGSRLPALVLLHPNGYGQFYDHWNPFFHFLAQSGYVLLLVDQRGSAGYGRAFRMAQIGNWGTGTFDDVVAAARFIKDLEFVDGARLGVMGQSFGGYQTLLALTRTPELFRAGVSLMGPTDRRGRKGDRYRELQIGAREEDDPALYARISPIASVASMRAPLLLIHSDADRNVPVEDTYSLIDELERQGKTFESIIYPGEAHGLSDPSHQLDSYRRILAFFERWLR
jgi:dipeptidyl aminopeptidase/acylaminoacyl peptidase